MLEAHVVYSDAAGHVIHGVWFPSDPWLSAVEVKLKLWFPGDTDDE